MKEQAAAPTPAQQRLTEAHAQLAFFYFLPDPEQFACDHWCDERVWQMVEAPVSRDEFEQRAELGAGAHSLARQPAGRSIGAVALACAQATSRSASRACRCCRAKSMCRTRSTSCR